MTPEWFEFRGFSAFAQDGCKVRTIPSPRAVRTVVEGLIWPFLLDFGHTPPIGVLKRVAIAHLTQAQLVTPLQRRNISEGTFASQIDHLGCAEA
jgi:hypothetical protein